MVADMLPAIEKQVAAASWHYEVKNFNRSIGARLSGEIARRWGNYGMAEAPLAVHLTGSIGQSFGVWNAGGLHMYLEGDANDYVGKGMAGGPPGAQAAEGARATWRAIPSSWAIPACTAPPAASCSRPARPASASRCATPAPSR